MLVLLAAPARSRRLTDSTFKAESMIDAKNKPILEEPLVQPPSQGVALKCVSSRDENTGDRLPTLARPVGEKCPDCKCHAPRRVSPSEPAYGWPAGPQTLQPPS